MVVAVVAAGRVWVTTAIGSAQRRCARWRSISRPAAKLVNVEVFRVKRPAAMNPKNSRASPTPMLDGDRVYVHFGADGTAALTTTGEVVWKTRLPYESQHGNGGSPMVYGDLLIVSCDGSDSAFVVALDKRTGRCAGGHRGGCLGPGLLDPARHSRRRSG